MQDNPFNKSFMDEAWKQMHELLDEKMPPKKKRRPVLWWWLGLPLFFVFVISLYSIVQFSLPEEKDRTKLNPPPVEALQSNTPSDELIATRKQVEKEPSTIEDLSPTEEQIITNNIGKDYPTDPELSISGTNPLTSKIPDSAAVPGANISILTGVKAEPLDDQNRTAATFFTLKPINKNPALLTSGTKILPQLNYNGPKLKTRKTNLQIWAQVGYYHSLDVQQFQTYNFGIGVVKPIKRFRFGIDLNYNQGRFITNEAKQDDAFGIALESDPSTLSSPTFDPNVDMVNATASDAPLNIKYNSIALPLHLSYRLGRHWSFGTQIESQYILSFKSENPVSGTLFENLDQERTAFAGTNSSDVELTEFLNKRLFFEPGFFVSYYMDDKWQFQLHYQLGNNQIFGFNSYEWRRNQLGLQFRYRLK